MFKHPQESWSEIEKVLDSGLRLVLDLAPVQLAVAHLAEPVLNTLYVKALAKPDFKAFCMPSDLGSHRLLERISAHETTALILEGDELHSLQSAIPHSCRSLVVRLETEQEFMGALQLIGVSELADLTRHEIPLRACANLIARSVKHQKDLAHMHSTVRRYRDFISEVSEGVWRFEVHKCVSLEASVEHQVEEILAHSRLAECNRAMARMYGFENPQEMIGTPLSQLLVDAEPRNRHFLENFVRNGYRLSNAESVEKDRQGNTRYFVNNLVGMVSEEGLLGAWGTQADITAYKDLESRLTNAAQQAAEANHAKSKFLANISHEIRTPLGVIIGFADLALGADELSEETRGYITAIRRNGELVTEIVGEVLDLAKIEACRLEIEEIRFSLEPMLSEVISFLDVQARDKGLVLSLEQKGPLPRMVRTDSTRLRQILTNLIGNAIKFTEKGHVTLSVSMASPPKVGTPVQLEFTVSDTGIGIPPELREKLFQPFTQLEVSTSRRFGGTGLGLTLSKQLVQALGGDLFLSESHLGSGSTFAFRIAAGVFDGELWTDDEKTPPPVDSGGEIEEEKILFGKRVLVIEDSEDNQLLISHYLAAVGIRVEVASDGFEGLEKIRQGGFDLVVLDIQMPGMDGHEVARTLRESGFNRPIIALTAHAFKEDRELAFRNGFNEYLTKPINRTAFLQTLSHRLAASNLH